MPVRLHPLLVAGALLGGCSLAYDFDRAAPEGLGGDGAGGASVDRGPADTADLSDGAAGDAAAADRGPTDQGRDAGDDRDGDPPDDGAPPGTDARPGDAGVEDLGPPDPCFGAPRWVGCGTSPSARQEETCGDNGRWVVTVPCRVPPPDPCADRCDDCFAPLGPEAGPTVDRGYQASDAPDRQRGWDLRPVELGSWSRLVFDGQAWAPDGGAADGVADSSRRRRYHSNGDIAEEACTGCASAGTSAVTYTIQMPGFVPDHPGPVVERIDPGVLQQPGSPRRSLYLLDDAGRRVLEARHLVGDPEERHLFYRYDDPAVPDHPTEYVATETNGQPVLREVRRYDPRSGARLVSEVYAAVGMEDAWALDHTFSHDSACWRCDAGGCRPSAEAQSLAFVGFTAQPLGITTGTAVNLNAAHMLCSLVAVSGAERPLRLVGQTSATDLRRIGRRLQLAAPEAAPGAQPVAGAWVDAQRDGEGVFRWNDTGEPALGANGLAPDTSGPMPGPCTVIDLEGRLHGVACHADPPLPAVCVGSAR